jgi:two-component system, chemotaxis family, CheB/CheR fusion protein
MAFEHSAHRIEFPPDSILESPAPRTVRGHNDELTRIRLREALARIEALLGEKNELIRELSAWRENAANHVAGLSPRQRQIMELVVGGQRSKQIAADLGVSQRTVENHRASIMKKTGTKCIAGLTRLALAAAWNGGPDLPP